MELTVSDVRYRRSDPHSPKKGVIVTTDGHHVFDLRDEVYNNSSPLMRLDGVIGIIWGIYSHAVGSVVERWTTNTTVPTKVLYGAIRLGDTEGMTPKEVVQRFREVRDKLIKDDEELVKDPIKQLEYRCKHHDYWYMMSDASNTFRSGALELDRIDGLITIVGKEKGIEIWNKYCPEQLRRKV